MRRPRPVKTPPRAPYPLPVVSRPRNSTSRQQKAYNASRGEQRMSNEHYDPKKLLSLRRLTRSVADLLREQVKDHVATLAPLLRPRAALGDSADAGAKDAYQTS